MIHIDKYKIISYSKPYKNGKQSKNEEITKMLTSEECISGQDFVNLLNNLDFTWHKWEGKEITVEVTFKDTNG